MLAAEALRRVREGAYANIVTPKLLRENGAHLESRDKNLVTNLVYGTVRMQRACDHLIDRFVRVGHRSDVDPEVRDVLRLGVFQLVWLGTPPHAAVSETVTAAPFKVRGLINAVLRKVAAEASHVTWPDMATELSYPTWMVERLVRDLGHDDAIAALRRMNEPAEVYTRADGYTQNPGSSWVTEAVGARRGELVLDLCAAPGGKATAMAAAGAHVVASDINSTRIGLLRRNRERLEVDFDIVGANGTHPPFLQASFDRVLVDAPCSGLGVLRRRPDARWRLKPCDIDDLVGLQQRLLSSALRLVRPGGLLAYSVCTLTRAETVGIDEWLQHTYPEVTAFEVPAGAAQPLGRGARLLPQVADTDGMFLLLLQVPATSAPEEVLSASQEAAKGPVG